MISRRLQSKDDREASQQLYMISTIKYLGYIERGQLSQLIWGLRGQDHCKEVCIEKVVFNGSAITNRSKSDNRSKVFYTRRPVPTEVSRHDKTWHLGTAANLVLLKGKTLVRDMGQKLAKFEIEIKKDDILHYELRNST